MDFERLNGDIKEMRRRNRGLALTVGLLAAAHVLALVVILNLLGTVRTVVVPPSINKSFWVSRDKASGEYLEQMGAFIAWLVLDVTPASIDWKKDILLGYVEPDQHGELKTRHPRREPGDDRPDLRHCRAPPVGVHPATPARQGTHG